MSKASAVGASTEDAGVLCGVLRAGFGPRLVGGVELVLGLVVTLRGPMPAGVLVEVVALLGAVPTGVLLAVFALLVVLVPTTAGLVVAAGTAFAEPLPAGPV
jgi:hypothetical protein